MFTYRFDVVAFGVESEAVWEPLKTSQFTDGHDSLALKRVSSSEVLYIAKQLTDGCRNQLC